MVNVDLRPEKRVKVTFTCGNNSEIRSVDVYRTVNDLKNKLEGFAGFSAAKMRLFYVDKDLRDIQVSTCNKNVLVDWLQIFNFIGSRRNEISWKTTLQL